VPILQGYPGLQGRGEDTLTGFQLSAISYQPSCAWAAFTTSSWQQIPLCPGRRFNLDWAECWKL